MRKLVEQNNPILNSHANAVEIKNIGSESIQTLIREMRAILESTEHGVALAAPQVGEPLRLFIIRESVLDNGRGKREEGEKNYEPSDSVFINPEITKISRRRVPLGEGCLSIPGIWGTVPRAEKVTINAINERGERVVRGASGLLAHMFQHEVDHLNGILFTEMATEIRPDAPQ